VVKASWKHHSQEDIVGLLQRIEELLGNGSTIALACREAGVSAASYYEWRQRYEGGRTPSLDPGGGPSSEVHPL
jgi:transposase-like protein